MAQLVQLFVNGTIVFADMTDDVDAVVVKADGVVLLQTSVPEKTRKEAEKRRLFDNLLYPNGETDYLRCPADRHWVLRTNNALPCPYCYRNEQIHDTPDPGRRKV